jgi:hypothetical protein
VRWSLALAAALALGAHSLYAADSYQVNSGATADITEHGTCKRVTNAHASGLAIFVRAAANSTAGYGTGARGLVVITY